MRRTTSSTGSASASPPATVCWRCAFGRDSGQPTRGSSRATASRAKRVLFLSATPIEETYRQLWNQLDVFGLVASGFDAALDDTSREDEKKVTAQHSSSIRRVTTIRVGGQELTKNQYRREWRRGGVQCHDEPIMSSRTAPERSWWRSCRRKSASFSGTSGSTRLSRSACWHPSRASSRPQSSSVTRRSRPSTTPSRPTTRLEREGIDVNAVNRLAAQLPHDASGGELPHPKMDALVDIARDVLGHRQKALVFVRRVASVKELKRKLDERYDEWLLGRLRRELPEAVLERFEGLVQNYREERRALLDRGLDVAQATESESQDSGSADTFFAWFFRGEGPRDVISGANIQQRFVQRGTTFSTFFEDNYVAAILGCEPAATTARMAAALDTTVEDLRAQLQAEEPEVSTQGQEDRASGSL